MAWQLLPPFYHRFPQLQLALDVDGCLYPSPSGWLKWLWARQQ
jgi:hypothetical protein